MAGCHLKDDLGAAFINAFVDLGLYDIRDRLGAQDG